MSASAVPTTAVPPLADLARQARADRQACELLLQRCRPIVYSLVLDRVHNPEPAEDLTQEVLADMAQALPRLREPRAFHAWLRQIAINRCRQWWRRCPEEPRPLSDDYQRLVREDVFAEAARRETWRELQRALDDLPEKSRLALLMHVLGGLNQAEIAEALGATVTSVAVRIHRARQRLRTAMQPLAPITEEEWRDAT
jgi:RNA polymerase sigma factor (sigma-70 family)